MPLTKIQSLGITDGTIVNADINASAGITLAKLSGVNDAKAWVNFNGTGTVAIRASFNVSSITDNGTGDYTVNFTTAMPDGDYGFTFGGARDTSGNECYHSAYDNGVLTTSLRVRGWSNSTVTARDMTYFCVSIFR